MTRMNPKCVLSLGAVFCLVLGGNGCKWAAARPVSAKAIEIPEVSLPPLPAAPAEEVTPAPEPFIAEATENTERPYMAPSLIPGLNEGDPLFENLPEPTALSGPAEISPAPLPVEPAAGGLPVLEQPPGTPTLLALPNGVLRNEADGLYYQAGHSEPYTGSAVLIFANGQREFEGFFKNGRREGKGIEWYVNGKKRAEGTWQGGALFTGHRYWYYLDNLLLKARADYEQGRMVAGHHWDRFGQVYR